ncbi:hypothetical protein SAMN05421820_107133 [Pedobacter steynii]|uniref:Uncharacterized protein n=1 Tax=Pedobacter steynii TaxID=430522 RepID=A0A1H0AMY9_9SPHI|nr:hypothetical protein [Pedobacter steynii]NQX41325.1 hypothetical protein [Pedobacter steynii]SDN34246.1 hypothetical protein SAMN05421820_107133 [Pedobacter steynii]
MNYKTINNKGQAKIFKNLFLERLTKTRPWVISGEPGYGMIFFSGFISGYLVYVSLHFAIHAYAPPKYFTLQRIV